MRVCFFSSSPWFLTHILVCPFSSPFLPLYLLSLALSPPLLSLFHPSPFPPFPPFPPLPPTNPFLLLTLFPCLLCSLPFLLSPLLPASAHVIFSPLLHFFPHPLIIFHFLLSLLLLFQLQFPHSSWVSSFFGTSSLICSSFFIPLLSIHPSLLWTLMHSLNYCFLRAF